MQPSATRSPGLRPKSELSKNCLPSYAMPTSTQAGTQPDLSPGLHTHFPSRVQHGLAFADLCSQLLFSVRVPTPLVVPRSIRPLVSLDSSSFLIIYPLIRYNNHPSSLSLPLFLPPSLSSFSPNPFSPTFSLNPLPPSSISTFSLFPPSLLFVSLVFRLSRIQTSLVVSHWLTTPQIPLRPQ